MIDIGVVVIGRNEGERLQACIRSLSSFELYIVYVDSGSTDDSVSYVKSQGFDVVELDMSVPFSAARARNDGFNYLVKKYPEIQFVQFVDGDCQVCSGWIDDAHQHLLQNTSLASVCGRRKERYPEQTIYNQLCDIEWNTPIGVALATGGDFMCRKQAMVDVNGFNDSVIAGEEPELCFRMRQKGWKIERLDADMTLHDANMTQLSEWWKRSERSGHAYAQGFYMHGHSKERYYRIDVIRILLWALVIPISCLLFVPLLGAWALSLLFIYPLKIIQIFISQGRKFGFTTGVAYAASLVLGKFPQLLGMLMFCIKCLRGQSFQIIEYKS